MKILHKIRFLTMGLLISMLAIGGGVVVVASEEEAKGANSDVTIYLDHPILTSGGTVMVLPTEVDKEVWAQQQGIENPAQGDRVLDNIRPIQSADRRLGVIVSAPMSIVRFHFHAAATTGSPSRRWIGAKRRTLKAAPSSYDTVKEPMSIQLPAKTCTSRAL